VASVTGGLNHTTQYLLDGRGRLLAHVLGDGTSTYLYYRDPAGQVTVAVDPLHHATIYTYVYGTYNPALGGDGDLVQQTNADRSWVQYRYDPTFLHLTQQCNPLGVALTDTYDPSTGDLLTSKDGLGNTTRYAWAAGLLLSVTDPRGDVSMFLVPAGHRITAESRRVRQRHFRLRRQRDSLGEGHPCTWPTLLIKVAAEVVVRTRRIVVRLSSSGPHLDWYRRVCELA
jgi:YD repeat-containing protein